MKYIEKGVNFLNNYNKDFFYYDYKSFIENNVKYIVLYLCTFDRYHKHLVDHYGVYSCKKKKWIRLILKKNFTKVIKSYGSGGRLRSIIEKEKDNLISKF